MKKNKLPSLIIIMILTLITSILWVSLSVYRAFAVKSTESVPNEISDPITPTLDQGVIKKIESEIFFDSSQIPENVVVILSSPIPSQPAQTPLPTPTPVVTPTASSSGTPQP